MIISMSKKELGLLAVFLVLFAGSLYGIFRLEKTGDAIPVIAVEEYLVHEGTTYQRTLSVVAVIDRKLTPTSAYYQGRPLYKETSAKVPDRLLWPLEEGVYAVFVKVVRKGG
ncbi:MAG: hypothetical protein ACOX29_07480 [Bacillota bacterium]|jgi:hypothetical protein|nr:hypothetical protein [Bacillota bacterium]NLU54919.1 hypothetical protein [Bacillota bacterium]HOA91937.1 hypothetical protein [Bacillota bacterium]HOP53190.1 hypothetical protein [Bacillota bacterium]HPT61943.1 hypothetical protein [Bacillota bacterium]